MNCSCAILAGGKSTRMGQDKTAIKIGEKAMTNLVYKVVKKVFDDVIIASGFQSVIEGIGAPVLKDARFFGGFMTRIALALLYSKTPYIFMVICYVLFATELSI